MKENLTITHEQFHEYIHCRRMIEIDSQQIQELCSTEQDDILIGFELGKIHTHLRECFSKMLDIENQIHTQNK